jgi:lysophospholipase L1-like esterase
VGGNGKRGGKLPTGASLALACLAIAAPAARAEATRARIGRVGMAAPRGGRGALLISIRYPIQLNGRAAALRVSLRPRGRGRGGFWTVAPRVSAGPLAVPERRRRFSFVYRIGLDRRLARLARSEPMRARIEVGEARGPGGGVLGSGAETVRVLSRRGPRHLCASVPQLRIAPGRRLRRELPVCGSPVRWRISAGPAHGRASIRDGSLTYRSASGFRGTDSIELRGGFGGGSRALEAPVEVKVERGPPPVVRALGDSITAGFGYYDDGSQMPAASLGECIGDGRSYAGACSSNSTARSAAVGGVVYAPDYGLSNNVSWAAQWANEHGVSDYENLAVGGSLPSDWAPGGVFYPATARIESEDPGYVLLTVGANPLLSMLFDAPGSGCAAFADPLGDYSECLERALRAVGLRGNLESLYSDLLARTGATIFAMQYPLSIPSSAVAYSPVQIAMLYELIDREIAAAAAAFHSPRLQALAPPHFDAGVDISPVYPSTYPCPGLGAEVDGPSVQSGPTQSELLAADPLSFCPGPAAAAPWTIAGDTGLHPSATGYAQMASRVPPPTG